MSILEEIDSFYWQKNTLMKRCQKNWAGTSPAWLFNEINPDTFRQNSTCTFPAVSTTQQSLLHSLPESHPDVLGYYWKPWDIWIVGLQCQRLLWLSSLVSCAGFGASSSTSSHVWNIHKSFELSKNVEWVPQNTYWRITPWIQRPISFCKTEN